MSEVVGSAEIEIHADDSALPAEVFAAAKKASARAKVTVQAKLDQDGFTRDANGVLRDAKGRFAKGMSQAGSESGGFFSRSFESAASRAFGGIAVKIAAVLVAALAASSLNITPALGGVVAAVVALTGVLVQASGAAISLGVALSSLGLAAVATKVGLSGVSDAMKAQTKAMQELAEEGKVTEATQKKLDAALKNLAPSARATVIELGKLGKEWTGVRRVVQGNLFAGVATQLRLLSGSFKTLVQSSLGAAAARLNATGVGLSQFLRQGEQVGRISRIFDGLNRILGILLQAVKPLADAFLRIFEGALPSATGVAQAITSMAQRFDDFIKRVTASGQFQDFLDQAVTFAGQLLQVLGNVGRILGSVFAAGNKAGAGLLNTLVTITGQFADFLASAEGQEALSNFFDLIAVTARVAGTAMSILGPVISGIAAVFRALAPAIEGARTALTPVLQILGQALGQALASLGPALAAVVKAITPVIAILGVQFARILTVLGPAIAQVVTALAPLIGALGTALATALVIVIDALLPLVPIIAQFAVTLAAQLVPIVIALTPVLIQLALSFAQILTAILPVLPSIIGLIPPLGQLGLAFANILVQLIPVIAAITKVAVAILSYAVPAQAGFNRLVGQFIVVLAQVVPKIASVIGAVVSFTSRVTGAVVSMSSNVVGRIASMVASVVSFFSRMAGDAISRAIRLVTGVIGAVSGLPGRLGSLAASAARAFVNAFSGIAQKVAGAFRSIPGAVKGIVDQVVSAFAALPSRLLGLVDGLGAKIAAKIKPKIDIPGVPGLATGGLVTRPTLAVIGEGTSPELVIPTNPNAPVAPGLEALLGAVAAARGVGGGSGSRAPVEITQTIALPTGDPFAAALAVGDQMVSALEQLDY
jgi:phage-related protein